MNDTFNFRNPEKSEVIEMHHLVKSKIAARQKYKVLSKILNGEKNVDVTVSPEIFEALNRECMEFEELLNLHPDQAKDAIEAANEDKQKHDNGRYWNRNSPAKWGCLGHIPPCCYYARPAEYWKDKKILREFFNMFPKFRVSDKRL